MSDHREAETWHFRERGTFGNTVKGSFNTTYATTQGSYNTHHTHNAHNVNYYQISPEETNPEIIPVSKVAFSALHDSEARYPQPNVLPGTRKKIIQELVEWVENSSAKKSRVHWVHGAAGVGKSAIAQALSERFIESGQLAAAFFFSRNDASRDKLDPFIATITHQLVTSRVLGPLLSPLVDHTIRSTPGIWEKNWELQFRAMIQEPCAQVDPRRWESLPRLVIIDGVDECNNVESQKRLLEMIKASTATLPLDFLIFSRPEPNIAHVFRHESFIPAPHIMSLGDFAVRDDIEKYLREEFSRLRERHKELPVSWPGDNVIMVLVDRSTGQFIYVTTVVKFINTGKVPLTPEGRLQVVLRAERVSNSASPYPDLDQLYSQILYLCLNDGRKLQRVLQFIIKPVELVPPIDPARSFQVGPPTSSFTSAIVIELLLGLDQGEATVMLSGLHSILHIPEDRNEGVSVLHASFTDFLLDPNRSGDYYVGERLEARSGMLIAYQLKRLSRLATEYESTPYPEHDLGALNVWNYLNDSLRRSDHSESIALIDEIVEALNAFDPYLYLEMVLYWYVFLPSATNETLKPFAQAPWRTVA
ncbi:hypothetical protein PQX77_005757 [Marasmius sp. AFHP31]|nr:hypothetical protein PQX77_005757 [Marasmius sp. AFHP31]